MYKFHLLILISFLISGCSSQKKADPCVKRWGAVEYGTSRIKLLVSDVNVCQKSYLRDVLKQEWELETDKSVHKDHDGSVYLDRSVIERTTSVTTDIQALLTKFKTQSVFGVATGIYRSIATPDLVLQGYGKIIGTEIRVISNIEEASLGITSLIYKEKPKGQFIVWDFGGNSMQFTLYKDGHSTPFVGFPGSTPVRNEVITYLRKQHSPNPIGQEKRSAVENHMFKKLFQNITKIPVEDSYQIFGIGGVHNKSVAGNIEILLGEPVTDKTYTIDQVNKLASRLVDLKDSEIGGKFSSSQASNVLAVHLVMTKLAWNKVTISDQTLTLGCILKQLDRN